MATRSRVLRSGRQRDDTSSRSAARECGVCVWRGCEHPRDSERWVRDELYTLLQAHGSECDAHNCAHIHAHLHTIKDNMLSSKLSDIGLWTQHL